MVILNTLNERCEEGRKIVLKKKELYNEAFIDKLCKVVRKNVTADDTIIIQHLYASIYCYWKYGCSVDEYFYLNLAYKSDIEIKEYVTIREKILYTNYLNKIEDAHLLNNKWDAYCLFREYYRRDVILIESEKDFELFRTFATKHHKFVVKPTDSGLGQGVHLIEMEENCDETALHNVFNSILVEANENCTKFANITEKSVLLEEVIKQSEIMASLHPQSVNAVRVTTVRKGKDVYILYPWIKIGNGGQFVVSAAYGSMVAGINPITGIINTPGIKENREKYICHPDTGTSILGLVIPRWDELICQVKEMALKLESIRYVGWDMVLTDNGWCMMEGNFRGDFMWQLFRDCGSKREMESFFGYTLNKDKSWWEI